MIDLGQSITIFSPIPERDIGNPFPTDYDRPIHIVTDLSGGRTEVIEPMGANLSRAYDPDLVPVDRVRQDMIDDIDLHCDGLPGHEQTIRTPTYENPRH